MPVKCIPEGGGPRGGGLSGGMVGRAGVAITIGVGVGLGLKGVIEGGIEPVNPEEFNQTAPLPGNVCSEPGLLPGRPPVDSGLFEPAPFPLGEPIGPFITDPPQPVDPDLVPDIHEARTRNVSGGSVTFAEALALGVAWLGPGYREIDSGVFRSADNKRQFRITGGDLTDRKQGAHAHFETVGPDGREITENSHVEIIDP